MKKDPKLYKSFTLSIFINIIGLSIIIGYITIPSHLHSNIIMIYIALILMFISLISILIHVAINRTKFDQHI